MTYICIAHGVNIGCEDLRGMAASRAQQDTKETVYGSEGICDAEEDVLPVMMEMSVIISRGIDRCATGGTYL